MFKSIAGVVAGIIVWIGVVTVLNFGLRAAIPGYHAAEPTFAFTLLMQLSRLVISAVSSVTAGAVAGWIGRPARWAPWVTGALFLAMFVPEHIHLGKLLPLWYHLTFLITLVPLFGAGGALVRKKDPAVPVGSAGTAAG